VDNYRTFVIPASLLLGTLLAGLAGCGTAAAPSQTPASTTATVPAATTVATSTPEAATATPGPTLTIPAQQPLTLASIHMMTSLDGWATERQTGRLLRTTDGGLQWQDVSVPGVPLAADDTTYFLDATHAWVVVAPLVSANGPATTTVTVYRTADGGQTWDSGTPITVAGGGPGAFDFVDSEHGWLMVSLGAAAGSEAIEIWRTIDGGMNWEEASLTSGFPDLSTPGSLPFGCDKSGVGFINPSDGWATGHCPGGNMFFYATHDGGQAWEWQALPAPPGYPAGLATSCMCAIPAPIIISPSEAFVAVGVYEEVQSWFLYATRDGGAVWTPTALPVSQPPNGAGPDFINADDGWVTDGATLYVTHDGGQTWSQVAPFPTTDVRGGLNFVNTNDGWFAGEQALYVTHDGGQTWSPIAPVISETANPPTTPNVTLADDGQTITLQVGQRFLLNLGLEYDWAVTVDDQSIVSRVINVLTIRGSQGLYEAHQAGHTGLTATGDPVCRQAQPPCGVPLRLFHLQIVVARSAAGEWAVWAWWLSRLTRNVHSWVTNYRRAGNTAQPLPHALTKTSNACWLSATRSCAACWVMRASSWMLWPTGCWKRRLSSRTH